MIQVVTEIFTARHRKTQVFMQDTVPFKIRLQKLSTHSNVVLLSTQMHQNQEIFECQTTRNIRKTYH